MAIFNTFVHPQEKFTEMAYSDFVAQIEKKNVSSVIMVENSIKGKLKDGTEFSTYIPNNDTQIVKKMTDGDVVITVKPPEQPSWWMSLLSSLLPILILVGVWFWIMNQTQGGGGRVMSFGRSRARMSGEGQVHVNFSDVAGEDEAKEELAEVVDFLKNPGRYTAIGAKIPKGVLLVGPPGTGKTLLAKAVAGEAKVPFFSISGSDFVEMFVGVGASRVRDLFAQAKKNAPCIVFIDEIDAVGRKRGSGMGGGHDEREQTLNQILVEMDGFEKDTGVIVLAATNRADVLDPALLRPGRFDRRVEISLPERKDRLAILEVHFKNKKVDESVDLNALAKKTAGSAGADLANIANEAAILAARNNRDVITNDDLTEAFEKVAIGPERKSKVMSDLERETTAWHEAGHAVVGHVLPDSDPVHKVTIIPRGGTGGVTWFLPPEDRSYTNIFEYKDILARAMGGRQAEMLIYGEAGISTGASSDLRNATDIARNMVIEFGMGEDLLDQVFHEENSGMFFDKMTRERPYSEKTAEKIDAEIAKLIKEAVERAAAILKANKKPLKELTDALLEKETLDEKEVAEILKNAKLPKEAKLHD